MVAPLALQPWGASKLRPPSPPTLGGNRNLSQSPQNWGFGGNAGRGGNWSQWGI
ncbi:MAG: hypothetical protein ACRC8A_20055 [Microcoleaceae cyanobacterium]